MASSWGLSWGTSWATSWDGEFTPPPVPDELEVIPAGRKTRRRRYYVEIDGRPFEVSGAEHARALLERAKETAQAHAEQLAREKVPTVIKRGSKPVALPTPKITTNDPELKQVVHEARTQINQVYRNAAIDAELALLLARRLAEEDEEEAILLLM